MVTNDLVAFLRARLDEDEGMARAASHVIRDGAHWSLDEWHGRETPHSLIAQGTVDQPVALGHFTADPVPTEQAAHIARHDPARVLAEIDAKRRLLPLHGSQPGQPWCRVCGQEVPCTTLRLLALPYAGHPEWREEWRP